MAQFRARKFALSFDVAGCPNRCRHCWIGNPRNGQLSEDTVRGVVRDFRAWLAASGHAETLQPVVVHTWFREPDFALDYPALWELEKELSDDGAAERFELLSIWRLARDEGYARWARDIGTEACQVTFFGTEQTTDYFARRKGYFRDSVRATEPLLDAGIRPRWQVILTRRGAPELGELVGLMESLRLEERVRALGSDFAVFLNTPTSTGEAYLIEDERPTPETLEVVPTYLAEQTKKHFGVSSLAECLGKPEREWIPELLADEGPLAEYPGTLASMVTPDLDVYPNMGEVAPWWRLGNLREEGFDVVMHRFQNDETPGLWANFHVPVSQLAKEFGRVDSDCIYGRGDLVQKWLRQWAEGRDSSLRSE